jgi:quercetin dioxygenase-like cupin family protein
VEPDSGAPADLLAAAGTGPVWGIQSDDLNATVLAWPAGHELAEHVNAQLDVLVVGLEGDGTVIVDGDERRLAAGHALLVPKGARRSIRAGAAGFRYLSVHRRRGPLQIEGAPG